MPPRRARIWGRLVLAIGAVGIVVAGALIATAIMTLIGVLV